MKKIVILLVIMLAMVGCRAAKNVDEQFMEKLTDTKSYKVEGMMETFYDNDRKQNEFVVYYKHPDLLKVSIKSLENNDQQIIVKNDSGVYVLIPSVNKNFKIQSSWPQNASYPYLLQSLAKDIANENSVVRVENETTIDVETETTMHTDANVVKQKITFDKETLLPTEVKVYDDEGELYIRVVFQSIELDYNISETEFDVNESLTYARLEYGEDGIIFDDRTLDLPAYFPAGSVLNSQTQSDHRLIMKFTGDYGFTIIQQFVDDRELPSTQELEGDVLMILGNVAVLTNTHLKFIYGGVEYILAAEEMQLEELVKIAASYMQGPNK